MNQLPSVLMLGWEYPPHNSGGLGEACRGLTQALADQGNQIYFTLPFNYGQPLGHMQLLQFPVATPIQFGFGGGHSVYGHQAYQTSGANWDQMNQVVQNYTDQLGQKADLLTGQADIIHAHDWMTFPAGQMLKQTTGKPLITHIHSTEFDRVAGDGGNPQIAQIEYQGLQASDQIITVSQYTRDILVKHYGIDRRKVTVVHNGIAVNPSARKSFHAFAGERKWVAFMGRLTGQKGLPYFLLLAKKILTQLPETLFVIAGDGDMYHELMLSVADQGLTGHVLFSGFIRDNQKNKLLARADVFVMPSLSEPFGLVALEAAAHRTPVVMSDQTGVGEVLSGSIALPLSDLDQMAASVIKLLTVKSYRDQVVAKQLSALKNTTWSQSATAVQQVYQQVRSS